MKIILTVGIDEAKAARNILEKYPVGANPSEAVLNMLAFNAKLTKAIKRQKRSDAHEQDDSE